MPSVLVAGATVTDATGTTVTVIADVPFLPSLVAVIVADPAPTAVTSPLADTVAIAGALLAQVTARPARGLPLASFGGAVIWTVCPSSIVAEAGLTDTDATGTNVTVIAAVPFWPSQLAMIVAVPAAPPVTSPFPLTEATAALLVAHVTIRPLNGLPFASFGVAVSCTVCPTATLAAAGLTRIDVTGASVTVTVAVSAGPPLFPLATILTLPVSEPAL